MLARGRVRDDRAEPAAVEDQRLARVDPDPVHPADDVVTARDHMLVGALDVRDGAVKQQRAVDARRPVQTGELVVRVTGEPLCDLLLV